MVDNNINMNISSSVNMSVEDNQPWQVLVSATVVYAVILVVGCVGNISVIWVICSYSSMRKSVMNIYILNMAIADLTLNLCGIPEVAQFLMARGYVLGLGACKGFRYTMVTSLYVSILSLLIVTVERSAAILYPIKAHTLLTKRRITIAVSSVWCVSTACALPIVIYNDVKPMQGSPAPYCVTDLSRMAMLIYKYTEFTFFFVIPFVTQVTLYLLITKRLNQSTILLKSSTDARAQSSHNGAMAEAVKEQFGKSSKRDTDFNSSIWKSSNTVQSRRRVVRMLTACVMVYFVSYTPVQVLLFYETFSKKPFADTWFLKSVMYTLGFINASANPIIYCVCSESYRSKFAVMYGCVKEKDRRAKRLRHQDSTLKSGGSMRTLSTAAKTDANSELHQLNRVEEEEGEIEETVVELR